MNSKEKEEQFQQDTEQLRNLISQVNNSGILAWDAGDILKKVKNQQSYKTRFRTFERYTKNEFEINPQTANNYITIREKFDRTEIGNVMLVSHLRVIAEIENDRMRKTVLTAFKKQEDLLKKTNNQPSNEIYKTKLQDVVATVSMIIEGGEINISEDEINTIVKTNIEIGREQAKKNRKSRKKQKGSDDKAKFGDTFTSDFFKDVSALIENEPINEMGVVALFCVMFQSLRGTQIKWKNELITFISIKYIRAEFPDACVRSKNVENKKNFELDIEFEFESYNYIRHGHSKSKNKCDMIVCWIDNAKTNDKLKDKEAIKKMPPVLSLKNCFETGDIELIK